MLISCFYLALKYHNKLIAGWLYDTACVVRNVCLTSERAAVDIPSVKKKIKMASCIYVSEGNCSDS